MNSAFFGLIRKGSLAMIDSMKKITGSQIKLARSRLDLSKPMLADRVKNGVTTISRMEKAGDEIPDVKWQTLHGISDFLAQELKKIGWHFKDGGILPIPKPQDRLTEKDAPDGQSADAGE